MKHKQPKAKTGTTFTAWAPANWGILLGRTFRTRKEAVEWVENREGAKWDEVKDHYTIAKVKVQVM